MRFCTRAAVAALIVAGIAVSTLSSCSISADDVHFARTSARIIQPADSVFPVNFILVASPEDKIFREYDGLTIENVGVMDATAAPLMKGETRGEQTIASIAPMVPLENAPFEFGQVTVHYTDGTNRAFDVGSWAFEPQRERDSSLTVANWPAMLSNCSAFERTLPDTQGENEQVELVIEQPGVSLGDEARVEIQSGKPPQVNLSLECDPAYDFFVVTTELQIEQTDGTPLSQIFDPIMIGYMNISDDDIARINKR